MRRKSKWLRRTLPVLGVIAVLFAVALVIGEHQLKGILVRIVRVRTGRDIRVDGVFEAHLLARHPTITANKVSIGNPPWMPAGKTADVGRLVLTFEWRRSVRPLGISRLEIENASLHLMRDATGRANWTQQAAGSGNGPPLIRSLSMPNARVELNDARRHLQFNGTVSAGDSSAGRDAPPLRIVGTGQLNGRAVAFAVDADPLSLVRRERPYHFSFEEHSGATQLIGRGLITQPFHFGVLQSTFAASGPDMKDVYFLVGLGLPDTGPYRLSGRLDRQGTRFVYSELAASSGNSDMNGTLSIDSSSGRTRIDGELHSRSLRLADIGAHAAGLAPEPSAMPNLRLPDTPLRLGRLLRADAAIQFRASALTLGPEQLRSVAALVAIDRGVLSIEGFKSSLADGSIAGSARLDASHQVPQGQLNLRITDLRLDQFKGKGGEPAFVGLLSGRVQLSGQGRSFHELAAAANGTMTAVVPHGAMRASIADAASLDLIGALGARLKRQEATDMRCAVTNIDAHNGVLSASTFVIDTKQVLITGTGDVHMDSERLDFKLSGQPKNAKLASRSAISIQGTLRHPQLKFARHDVLAAALKVVLEPVAAVLSLVDPKLPRNADCAALIAQTQSGVAGSAAEHASHGK